MHHASAPPVSPQRRRLIELLLEREGPTCAYCGVFLLIPGNVEWRGDYQEPDPDPERGYVRPYLRLVTEVRELHIDHAQPRALGGTDHPDNLRLSCGPCNLDKGTTPEWEYLAELAEATA